MQVLKKICLIIGVMILSSCSSDPIRDEGWSDSFNSNVEEINISTDDSFRVGMLLPLTGSDAKYGTGLKYASMLALQDINNPKLVLQYYDTQSSISGARTAVENAINQQSDLIIGPLKSTEVQAISNETIYQGVPVIAFSTSQDVLQPTIYTLGLMLEEQIDRIMTYATNTGRKRFALLLPDNSTGGAVAKAAVKSAQKNGVEVKVIGFYTPGNSDFSSIVKEMTNYEKRHERVVDIKNKLEELANNGDEQAEKALKKIATREGLGDVGFDAVIIPETGAKLTSAISMFAYFDASYPDVQFLGTSIWDLARLNNEVVIAKSLYPTVSKNNNNNFANQYYMTFGEKPSSLYTLAYDAIRVADQLANSDNDDDINKNITSVNGFSGLNGKVRFFKNGTNQHSLDIVEIMPSGNRVVDDGNVQFETVNQPLPMVDITNGYCMPKIYGKDETLAQIVIYGQTASGDMFDMGICHESDDSELVKKQLNDMGIYIN